MATFHDRDGNGALTLWPIGLPKETYGFSNDARGRFGPPGFEAAAFDLPTGGARGRFGPPGFEAAAFDLPTGGARQAIRLR